VQYIYDLSQAIKLLVDHHADEFKLVMTGSSSALIKNQFRESLVGRKHIFELYPLSFDEFLRFREEDSLAGYILSLTEVLLLDPSAELRKSPKAYFVDTEIRNVLLPDFNGLESRVDRGALFGNFVYRNLFNDADPFSEIRYWRTRNKQKVDFVVKRENSLRAFDCKFSGGKSVSWKAFLNADPQAVGRTVVLKNADQNAGELYGWQKLL